MDGAVHAGEVYDTAWRWSANDLLARSAANLALLWRLEGNRSHLSRALEILKGYVAQYPTYQSEELRGENPGVVTFTTLDESAWVIPLAWTYDMIRDDLAGDDAASIAHGLFVPTAEHLVAHHFGNIHNVACWHNAAIGTLGLILDRQDLLDFALHSACGLDAQLREGVLADGLWWEGSFSYHYYTLTALLALAKALRFAGDLDSTAHETLRKMLHAPILCAYPDGSLPATNDCWFFASLTDECCHGVPPAAAFYELGYAWYGEPAFAGVLQRAYARAPRDSLDALLFGTETLPPVEAVALPSVHLPHSGYAILREPALRQPVSGPPTTPSADGGNERFLLLKHGPHGGVHGHPDKLSLTVYSHGCRLSPDLGTPGYGLDLVESWYRQTLSHNTVTVDGLSQPVATGQIVRFSSEGVFQVADAMTTWVDAPYEGISMRRVILSRPDYFLDLFSVQCTQERRIDWVYRNAGLCAISPDTEASALAEEGHGYEHILGVTRAVTDGDVVVNWTVGDVGLRLHLAGLPGTEAIAGTAPGNPPTDLQTLLISRRRAAATAYVSVFHPYGQTDPALSVEWTGRDLLGAGWIGCVVQLAGRRESWLIRQTPGQPVRLWPGHAQADVQCEYSLE